MRTRLLLSVWVVKQASCQLEYKHDEENEYADEYEYYKEIDDEDEY